MFFLILFVCMAMQAAMVMSEGAGKEKVVTRAFVKVKLKKILEDLRPTAGLKTSCLPSADPKSATETVILRKQIKR